MNQTSIIAASLIVAYVVFITVRGELPAYLAVFTGPPGATSSGAGGKLAGVIKNFLPDDVTGQVPSAPTRPDGFPGYNPGFNYFGPSVPPWDPTFGSGTLNDPNNPYYGAN